MYVVFLLGILGNVNSLAKDIFLQLLIYNHKKNITKNGDHPYIGDAGLGVVEVDDGE